MQYYTFQTSFVTKPYPILRDTHIILSDGVEIYRVQETLFKEILPEISTMLNTQVRLQTLTVLRDGPSTYWDLIFEMPFSPKMPLEIRDLLNTIQYNIQNLKGSSEHYAKYLNSKIPRISKNLRNKLLRISFRID